MGALGGITLRWVTAFHMHQWHEQTSPGFLINPHTVHMVKLLDLISAWLWEKRKGMEWDLGNYWQMHDWIYRTLVSECVLSCCLFGFLTFWWFRSLTLWFHTQSRQLHLEINCLVKTCLSLNLFFILWIFPLWNYSACFCRALFKHLVDERSFSDITWKFWFLFY